MITLVLFIALLATAMGQSVVMTILPSLGRETGLSELQVASILSCSACIYAVGSTQWSRFAASKGNRVTVLIGLAGYSVGTLGFALAFWSGLNLLVSGSVLFTLLMITRMVQSTVMSATPPAVIGYIAQLAREHHLPPISLMGRITSANNLGQIFGPGFAGLMVGFGLVTPLFAIILLTCLALVLVWLKLPEQSQPHSNRVSHLTPSPPDYVLPVTPLIAFAVVIFLCMAMLQQSLVFLFIDSFQFSNIEAAQRAGMGMTLSALAAFSIQWTVVQRGALSLLTSLVLAAVLLVSGYFRISTADSVNMIYLGMVAVGAGTGIGYPTVTSAATSYCPVHLRTTVTGLISASPAAGYVVGPPIGALLYNHNSYYPFVACAALCGALLGVPAFLKVCHSDK